MQGNTCQKCKRACSLVRLPVLSSALRANRRPRTECWDLLSYNFATAAEVPGRALVDTAAQRGLIGKVTLERLDQHLMSRFGLRVQYTNEDGGTVRGVCGSEEKTPIAYIPIGLGGCSGLLRVQIVPGPVPCLLPAYLLTDMGSVIDMVGLNMFHTNLGVIQQMHRRDTGHVEVSITEYGNGFSMHMAASFGRSQVWSERPLPMPLRIAHAFDMWRSGCRQPILDVGGPAAGASGRPALGSSTRTLGEAGAGHAAERGGAVGGIKEGIFVKGPDDSSCSRRSWDAAAHGAAHWSKPILGPSASAVSNVHALFDEPRQQGLGLGQVFGVRGHRADSEVDPGPHDGVEHRVGASGSELQDAAKHQGGKSSQEGRGEYRDELDDACSNRGAEFINEAGPIRDSTYDQKDSGYSGDYGTTDGYDNIGSCGDYAGSKDQWRHRRPRRFPSILLEIHVAVSKAGRTKWRWTSTASGRRTVKPSHRQRRQETGSSRGTRPRRPWM